MKNIILHVCFRIVSNPEVLKAVRKRLLQEQAEVLNEVASINNAKLQVSITTLQSQINSLSAQHTALQLANSQLAAEKEEVIILPFTYCANFNFLFPEFYSLCFSFNVFNSVEVPAVLRY